MRSIDIGVGFSTIEGDEGNSFGLKMFNEFVVLQLKSDQQSRAMRFDEFAHFADQPFRGIG
jgi:hypothetical protein